MASLPLGKLRCLLPIALVSFALISPADESSEWDQFRGPGGTGVLDGAMPPEEPGLDNLAWKVSIPSGLSSPVIGNGRIFMTGLEKGRLVTLAIDSETGEGLWRREAPEVPLEQVHEASNPASSTPLVDTENVYVFFGSYGLICYDQGGNERWKKAIPTPKSLYGMSTSPIACGDNLILVLDNDENLPDSRLSKSRVIAVNRPSGELEWETARPMNRSGWSTPTIWRHGGGDELVILGNGRVAGYDAKTGLEKWFATGFSRETIAMPIYGDGKLYAAASMLGGVPDEQPDPEPFWDAVLLFDKNDDGKLERAEMSEHFTFPLRPELPPGHPGFGIPIPKDEDRRSARLDSMFRQIDKDRDSYWSRDEFLNVMKFDRGKPRLMAVRPGGEGDVTETHVPWQMHRSLPEIPSPLFYDGTIYMVRNGGLLAAVDTEDGELLYRERLDAPGQYSASPVTANGLLYLVSNLGVLTVAATGKEFQVNHQFDLDDPVFATPAIDESTIYVRGEKFLWAFRSESR